MNLPTDVLIYQLTFLSIKDLNSLFRTNSKLRKLTDNEYLWELKSRKDYQIFVGNKRNDQTWKAFYFGLLKVGLAIIDVIGAVCIYYRDHIRKKYIIQMKKCINIFTED